MPGDVLLDGGCKAKMADFGMAKLLTRLHRHLPRPSFLFLRRCIQVGLSERPATAGDCRARGAQLPLVSYRTLATLLEEANLSGLLLM
jgi:hypothetical protein